MTNPTPNSGKNNIPATKVNHITDDNELIRKDIKEKWNHLSHNDIEGLTSNDDLVKLVMHKYKLDKQQTEREVENVLHGRKFN